MATPAAVMEVGAIERLGRLRWAERVTEILPDRQELFVGCSPRFRKLRAMSATDQPMFSQGGGPVPAGIAKLTRSGLSRRQFLSAASGAGFAAVLLSLGIRDG